MNTDDIIQRNKDIKAACDRLINYINGLPQHTVTKHNFTTVDDDSMRLEMTVYVGGLRINYNEKLSIYLIMQEACAQFIEDDLQRMLIRKLQGPILQEIRHSRRQAAVYHSL